jgi:hypothetical protein
MPWIALAAVSRFIKNELSPRNFIYSLSSIVNWLCLAQFPRTFHSRSCDSLLCHLNFFLASLYARFPRFMERESAWGSVQEFRNYNLLMARSNSGFLNSWIDPFAIWFWEVTLLNIIKIKDLPDHLSWPPNCRGQNRIFLMKKERVEGELFSGIIYRSHQKEQGE